MAKKLLTEAQAWKEVARRFAEESERPKRTLHGLCALVDTLYWGEDHDGIDSAPLADEDPLDSMEMRIAS